MSTAESSSFPIVLGHTLAQKSSDSRSLASGSSLISVKYNFRPSIPQSSPGYLHSTNKSNTQWLLEYDTREREDDRRGTRSSAQGFQGSQAAGKDVDCVLVWDDSIQCYVLDRVASTFTFRYDRGHSKLSDKAREALSNRLSFPELDSTEPIASALGLSLADPAKDNVGEHEQHVQDTDKRQGEDAQDEDDEDEFARQLEMGLAGFGVEDEGKDSGMEELDVTSPPRAKTGLGLSEASGLRDDVLTPRGSPYIDRPKSHWESAKSNLGQSKGIKASKAISGTALSTPVVSPASITNSPRPTGLDSALSASSTWKPPAQRTNVAIAYDEDDEESEDDEEDEDEEEDDDDDDDDDDVDLDDYARQLESSLQG